MAATLAGSVDVAAVEEHIARYVVSCPLCRAVGQLGVAQDVCEIVSSGGGGTGVPAVIVVCKRCAYLMPLMAERIGREAEAA